MNPPQKRQDLVSGDAGLDEQRPGSDPFGMPIIVPDDQPLGSNRPARRPVRGPVQQRDE